ncbi:hypothetical protein ACIQU6_34830 [Streptomyces sp. NPDC090442]|uniref:hypothetical protein n=1 Tax=Streptomyces sp. NPDC090442 TaxID=3365962 RepID=UPI00380C1133
MSDLELLAAFPAYGEAGPVLNDWEAAEKALGVAFPEQFKRFLDAFGGTKFDDFLRVYRAGAENPNVDLIQRTLVARETLAKTGAEIAELLTERGSRPAELVRWGGTDNADMCLLIPHEDPEQWSVLTVIGRGREYDLYDGPVESYLLQVLRRDFISEVFPEDFPDDEPSYERNPWI